LVLRGSVEKVLLHLPERPTKVWQPGKFRPGHTKNGFAIFGVLEIFDFFDAMNAFGINGIHGTDGLFLQSRS